MQPTAQFDAGSLRGRASSQANARRSAGVLATVACALLLIALPFAISPAGASPVSPSAGDASDGPASTSADAPAAPSAETSAETSAQETAGALALARSNPLPRARGNSYNLAEDRTLSINAPGVLRNDRDNNALRAKFVLGVEFGRLELRSGGGFTYRPRDNWSGTDWFKYRACEKANPTRCSRAVAVKLSVASRPENPIARFDSFKFRKNQGRTVDAPGLLRNDSDHDGDALKVISYTQPKKGGVVCYSKGGFFFRPDRGFTGVTGFRYWIGDGFGGRDDAWAKIRVLGRG